jgi:hypothetical protein
VRRALAIIGILASLAVIAASASINAWFGWSLGHSPWASQILAGASIALDVLKALCPFFVFAAWTNGQPSRVFGACILWTIVLMYSAASAIGFASLNRAQALDGRQQASAHYTDLRSELDRVRAERAAIVTLRPSDAVATDIGAMQLRREWNASAGCQQPSMPPSWCQTYFRLRGELVEAQHREALTARRDQLVAETAQLPAISQADTQAAVLGDIIPIPTEAIRTGLALLVAIAMELGSSLGLYVSTSTWNAPRNARDDIVSAKIDALSAKFDRVDEKRNSLSEMPTSLDEKPEIALADQPPNSLKTAPQLVAQDGKIVHPQFDQRKALIANNDPSAHP